MGTHRVYREHKYAFGKQLLTLRTRTTLTQSALAEQLDVHRRSVQNWETGASYPKAEQLQRLIAVFLRHHAFTPGNEREEAQALWEQATQDGPHPLPFFDQVWFVRTLALNDDHGTINDELRPAASDAEASSFIPATSSGQAAQRSSLIDWGEAIAVPMLHGREGEIQTLQHWVVE